MRNFAVLLPLVCGLVEPSLFARHDPPACGTHADRIKEELFLHRRSAVRHGRGIGWRKTSLAQKARRARNIGNIALIDDSDGVIDRRNPFDLNQKTLSLSRRRIRGFELSISSQCGYV